MKTIVFLFFLALAGTSTCEFIDCPDIKDCKECTQVAHCVFVIQKDFVKNCVYKSGISKIQIKTIFHSPSRCNQLHKFEVANSPQSNPKSTKFINSTHTTLLTTESNHQSTSFKTEILPDEYPTSTLTPNPLNIEIATKQKNVDAIIYTTETSYQSTSAEPEILPTEYFSSTLIPKNLNIGNGRKQKIVDSNIYTTESSYQSTPVETGFLPTDLTSTLEPTQLNDEFEQGESLGANISTLLVNQLSISTRVETDDEPTVEPDRQNNSLFLDRHADKFVEKLNNSINDDFTNPCKKVKDNVETLARTYCRAIQLTKRWTNNEEFDPSTFLKSNPMQRANKICQILHEKRKFCKKYFT